MRLVHFLAAGLCALAAGLAAAAPSVSLVSPWGGTVYLAPADLRLTANAAADPGATLARVDFYANGTLIGSDAGAPYGVTWSAVPAGAYSLTAVATDSLGASATSAAVSVTVTASNAAPTVGFSSPAANARYLAPATVPVTAWASGVEANTPLTEVAFYANGTLIGADTTYPYGVDWIPAPGTYVLTAKATDSQGAATTTPGRTVTVVAAHAAPTASLTAPAANATLLAPASLTLSAAANPGEANVPITRVEFLDGATVLATLTAPPYTYAWNEVPTGTHALSVRATDSQGTVATSAVRTLTVNTTHAPPAVALTAPGGNVSYLAPASVTLTATAAPGDANVPIARVEFLDGATVLATLTAPPYTYAWSGAAPGAHPLTARVTDSQGTVSTSAARTVTINATNAPPIVGLSAPAAGSAYVLPATVPLTAWASGVEANTPLTEVAFYANGVLIGTDTTYPYAVDWTPAAPGSYALSVRATDSAGGVTTSAPRTVTAVANQAPTVALTSPAANASFTAPATLALAASAADADGTVAKVEFYRGTTLVGTATAAPYTLAWTNVPAGNYTLTAKAIDDKGGVAVSAPVDVVVTGGVYYLHADHLGTPRLVTDAAGQAVWRRSPLDEPFGVTPPETDPDGNGVAFTLNLRFPGQYFDKETNLNYNYNRDYDPSTGRYIQSDPIGLAGGINTYAYVGGNPLVLIDPEGLAGAIPKNFGKGKELPPPEKLPNDTKKGVDEHQQKTQDLVDTLKCVLGIVACEALQEIQKATMCVLSICTTCDGRTFYTGPKAKEASAFDPSNASCKCIQYGLDPNYQGGAPPGLTPPGR